MRSLLAVIVLAACGTPPADDAGTPPTVDAGPSGMDAGTPAPDSGPPAEDAGRADAGGSDAGAPDAGAPDGGPPPSDCVFDGWCWVDPTPFGVALNDVWGVAADDVWAVGPRGFIAHFDGASWAVVPTPATDADLHAVHGTAADHVFAVGDEGTILRWDGVTWTSVTSPTTLDLQDVFLTAADDGWAVGEDRARVRYDGAGWTPYDTEPTFGPYTALWASAPDDVWLGSAVGGFQHFDGTSWGLVDAYPVFFGWRIGDLWGSGPNDVWAVSADTDQRVGHWDGTSWERVSLPTTPARITPRAVGGRGPDDVWFFGQSARAHFDGSTITVVDTDAEYATAVHLTASDGWAIGESGRIFRQPAGGSWVLAGGLATAYSEHFDVTPARAGGVYSFATEGIGLGDAGRLTPIWTGDYGLVTAFEAAPGDVWATGRSLLTGRTGTYRFDGTTVTPVSSDLLGPAAWDIWASASDDVYLGVGDDRIVHWDGAAFSGVYDGGSRVDSVRLIEGVSASDIFAVTGDGDFLRGSGTSWTAIGAEGDVRWTSLRAIAGDDVWIGGGGATIWHWDGAAWTPSTVPDIQRPSDRRNSPYVVAIVGDDARGLTALTERGHVLRRVGSEWVRDRTLPATIRRAAMAADGSVWVASELGLIYRR